MGYPFRVVKKIFFYILFSMVMFQYSFMTIQQESIQESTQESIQESTQEREGVVGGTVGSSTRVPLHVIKLDII
jgi:hypothetical protein